MNIAHNYAEPEEHFGKEVRKRATRARSGEYGIIPGAQGSRSFIVIGKGNPESFCSCSHGAGRKMGRNQKELDEAAGACKDIETVMENQSDLVEIAVGLLPLAVIKG